MIEKRIPIGTGQRLALEELAADAVVSGWDEGDVLIRLQAGDEQDVTVEQSQDGPAVSVRRPCEVFVPASTAVAVRQASAHLKVREIANLATEQVRGNLKLSEVGEAAIAEVYGSFKADEVDTLRVMGTIHGEAGLGEVKTADLQNVRGSLRVKECSRLRASRIGGNLLAKEIGGTFQGEQVGGNAVLKEVTGLVTLEQVAGNLKAKNLTGGAKVSTIGGNLAFTGELGAGSSYLFRAGGSAALRFPEGSGAHLSLSAGGEIVTSAKLSDKQEERGKLSGILGDGGAEVAVDAGGDILVSSGHDEVDEELGEEIARGVEESIRSLDLEGIGRQVSQGMEEALSRLRVKMESMDWERMGSRAQQAMERAMERMQREAERMAEQAERHQEWVQRRAEREARRAERWARRTQVGAAAGATSETREESDAPEESGPDLDQERLSILRMVEQGQITPAEAEMLLDALEP